MKELLKLEFKKLLKQKSLYICLAIMLGLILLSAIAYKVLMASSVNLGDMVPGLDNIDGIFFTLTTLSNADFFILVGIVIAITFCFDFEEHTVRNIISRGYSRTSLFFSKVIGIITATSFMFVCSFLFSFIMGIVFFGVGEGSLLAMFGLICLQFLACIAYSMFFTFICALCKKLSLSITINIVAPLVISILLMLLDTIINSNSFSVTNLWMDGMITSLGSLAVSTTSILIAVIGSLVYTFIFILGGALLSKKAEV